MKTKIEKLVEKRREMYYQGQNRAYALMVRQLPKEEKYTKARRLYHVLNAKFQAFSEMEWELHTDPTTRAWHDLGAAWMEAYEELRG